MKTGLLIITHSPLGHALNQVATHILGEEPDAMAVMDINADTPFEEAVSSGNAIARELNEGQGVLILTDCPGATPGNIATIIARETPDCTLVTGLGLPMLLRAINYQHQEHEELAVIAIEGGKRGACELPMEPDE